MSTAVLSPQAPGNVRVRHLGIDGQRAAMYISLPAAAAIGFCDTLMRVDISTGWSFESSRAGRRWLSGDGTASAALVDLPHTWNEHDTFQEGIPYHRGWGSYRRGFAIPSRAPDGPQTRWHLCSEGFYGWGDIWLNGRKIAAVEGQYLGFREDVSPFVRMHPSDNLVAIRLSNRHSRAVLPGIRDPDFLLYGGLAGRVWLESTPPVHLRSESFHAGGRWKKGYGGTAYCSFVVANESGSNGNLTAHILVQEADGRPLCEATVATAPGPVPKPVTITVPAPSAEPWSPDHPTLYTATLSLMSGGRTLDHITRRIGFRTAEFKPGDGFFLNGVRTHLHGCNRHESIPGFGQAVPASLQREDAAAIKRLGLNFVRLSHYPQHQAFLDACDEEGILVYAEIATWKSVRGYGRWLRAACRQMRGMILRDRSHPSVILWGMGNEGRSRRAYRKLQAVAMELDPDRPTIYAENHLHRAVRRGTTGIPDVWGCNYELGLLAEGAAASRLNSVVVTETSNYPPASRGNLQRELEQVALIEADLKRIGETRGVAGFALWCWSDYATMRKSRYFRHCGIVDAWREPKAAAWFLAALYSPQPMVRLVGDWSGEGGGTEREIHVFSNCSAVKLSVGGRHVLETGGSPHAVVRIPYHPAPLTARGSSEAGIAEFTLPAHGRCARLLAEPARTDASCTERETVPFTLRAIDRDGNTVAGWSGLVQVKIVGPARLRSYTGADEVLVMGGIGRGYITSTGAPGHVSIIPCPEGIESSPGGVALTARHGGGECRPAR